MASSKKKTSLVRLVGDNGSPKFQVKILPTHRGTTKCFDLAPECPSAPSGIHQSKKERYQPRFGGVCLFYYCTSTHPSKRITDRPWSA